MEHFLINGAESYYMELVNSFSSELGFRAWSRKLFPEKQQHI